MSNSNKIAVFKPSNHNNDFEVILDQNNDTIWATEQQIAKDVVTFLTWVSEPHLEARHKTGFKVILYLFVLVILVYFSVKKIWSRTETKV